MKHQYVPEGYSIITLDVEREEELWDKTVGSTPADSEYITYTIPAQVEVVRELTLKSGRSVTYTELVTIQHKHTVKGWADSPSESANGHDWASSVNDAGQKSYRSAFLESLKIPADPEVIDIERKQLVLEHLTQLRDLLDAVNDCGYTGEQAVRLFQEYKPDDQRFAPWIVSRGREIAHHHKMIALLSRPIVVALAEDLKMIPHQEFEPTQTSASDRFIGQMWGMLVLG